MCAKGGYNHFHQANNQETHLKQEIKPEVWRFPFSLCPVRAVWGRPTKQGKMRVRARLELSYRAGLANRAKPRGSLLCYLSGRLLGLGDGLGLPSLHDKALVRDEAGGEDTEKDKVPCDEPAQAADHLDGTLKSTGDEVGKGREEVDDHAEEARDDVGDGAEDAGKQVAEALEEVLDGGGEVRHGCRLLLSLILES